MDGSLPLSVQCELLGLNRSSLYYKPIPISSENVVMARVPDRGRHGQACARARRSGRLRYRN